MGELNTTVISILEAVATAERTDLTELPPLCDAIDPAALNCLVEPSDGARPQPRISFEYAGYEVTVDGARAVDVDPLQEAVPDGPERIGGTRPPGTGADGPLAE